MKSKRQKDQSSGFTLIELLVVIAIIALLMAIILPAINKAKEIALSVVCKSQLRDLSVMTQLYVQNNDGELMSSEAQYKNPDDPYKNRWPIKIAPYYDRQGSYQMTKEEVGRMKILRCPKESRTMKRAGIDMSDGWLGVYGYNEFFMNSDKSAVQVGGYYFRKMSNILTPSSLPLFADISVLNPYKPGDRGSVGFACITAFPHPTAIVYGWGGAGNALQIATFSCSSFGASPIHYKNINYAMADGHVESNGFWPWEDTKSSPLPSAEYARFFHPRRNISILSE